MIYVEGPDGERMIETSLSLGDIQRACERLEAALYYYRNNNFCDPDNPCWTECTDCAREEHDEAMTNLASCFPRTSADATGTP